MKTNLATIFLMILVAAGIARGGADGPNQHNNTSAKIEPEKNPTVEHTVREFLHVLNTSGGKPLETMSPTDAREVLVGAQKGVTLPPCDVEERTISQDGLSVKINIVRPKGNTSVLPVFMFFHGGGWVIGDFATHERFIRDLVVDSGFAAVSVEYSRSPEAKYPVAINEAFAATKWVGAHGTEIGVDPTKLGIAGNSVGGNMTAVIALKAKANSGPSIKCQILFWPVTDANFDTGSYHQFSEGYFLTKPMMKWFWDSYLPEVHQRKDIYASPLQATSEQLHGLPPALVETAGNDVLRDEGEAYARKLDGAGVAVTAVRYEGMIHDYGLLNPISDVPAVRDAIHQASEMLRKHLK